MKQKIIIFLIACFCIGAYTNVWGTNLINYLPADAKSKMTDSQRKYYDVAMSWPYSIKSNLATINLDQLDKKTLHFNFGTHIFTSHKAKRHVKSNALRHAWIGNVEGLNGAVHLVYKKDQIVGLIELEQQAFLIRPLGGGLHAIIEWDISKDDGCETMDKAEPKSADGGEALKNWHFNNPDIINKLKEKGSSRMATGECNVRVLVAYTDDVDAAVPDILLDINNMINIANTGYLNSSNTGQPIDWSIELAVAYQVNYTETGDMGTDLDCFLKTNDGCLDDVHLQRSLWDADQCALLTVNGTGLAKVNTDFDRQFSVTGMGNFYSHTFHHELGHNAECTHSLTQDEQVGTAPYAGWGQPTTGCFRTVLAYQDACGTGNCPRQNIFSDNDTNSWECGGTNYTPGTSNNRNQDRLHLSGPIIIDHHTVGNDITYGSDYNWVARESVHFAANNTLGYSSTENKFELFNGSEGSFRASQSVTLGRGFHARLGTSFRAYTESCTQFALMPEEEENRNAMNEQNDEVESRSDINQELSVNTDYEIQVFPNPFNHQINIDIHLKQEETLQVDIFNMNGQHVAQILPSQTIDIGERKIVFDSQKLPVGMYQIRIQSDKWVKTQKLIKVN